MKSVYKNLIYLRKKARLFLYNQGEDDRRVSFRKHCDWSLGIELDPSRFQRNFVTNLATSTTRTTQSLVFDTMFTRERLLHPALALNIPF